MPLWRSRVRSNQGVKWYRRMQSANLRTILLYGAFVMAAWLTVHDAAFADETNNAAPVVPVPIYTRQGTLVPARHPRTRLVDGSGRVLWNNPRCRDATQVENLWLNEEHSAIIDAPSWMLLPLRAHSWQAVGLVRGMHIGFSPAHEKGRVQEFMSADPSVDAGSYCIYEEFYRTPGVPDAGGVVYWSRLTVRRPSAPTTRLWQRPIFADNSGWPTPAPTQTATFVPAHSFFPQREADAEMHYRTGVLTDFGAGNKSGSAAIRDVAGRTYEYFTGWPIIVDGRRVLCAFPPRQGVRFDPRGCEGGWPANIVIGATRVRVYYWHAVTPWGQHVEVTDQIDRAP